MRANLLYILLEEPKVSSYAKVTTTISYNQNDQEESTASSATNLNGTILVDEDEDTNLETFGGTENVTKHYNNSPDTDTSNVENSDNTIIQTVSSTASTLTPEYKKTTSYLTIRNYTSDIVEETKMSSYSEVKTISSTGSTYPQDYDNTTSVNHVSVLTLFV